MEVTVLCVFQTSGYESELSSVQGLSSGEPSGGSIVGGTGTGSDMLPEDSSSVLTGGGRELAPAGRTTMPGPVAPVPSAAVTSLGSDGLAREMEDDWVAVQRKKKSARGEGKVSRHARICDNIDPYFFWQSAGGGAASAEDLDSGCGDTEELNFQFDDYGGKKYHFSDPLSM